MVQTSAQGILVSAIDKADDTLGSASKPQSVDSANQRSATQQQLTFAPAQDHWASQFWLLEQYMSLVI